MAITTVDDIAAGLASLQRAPFTKILTAPKAAGAFQSGWLAAGLPAAGAAAPAYTAGSGYTCSRTTTGAIPYTNGSVQNWLARVSGAATVRGTIVVADRLWSCSGMGFAAATYTVTTPGSLPARITDGGLGCELWIEQFAAAGAASGTATANYLDSAGGSKAGVISAVVSAPVAGQMQPVPLADNLGISQLTSIVTSATWTSGSFGATILKRIAEIPVTVIGAGQVFDWAQVLARIPSDACLMLFWLAETTTAPTLYGTLGIIDK